MKPETENTMMINKGALKEVSNPNKLKVAAMEAETKVILEAIELCDYNFMETAKYLGVDRKTLYNKINLYKIPVIRRIKPKE